MSTPVATGIKELNTPHSTYLTELDARVAALEALISTTIHVIPDSVVPAAVGSGLATIYLDVNNKLHVTDTAANEYTFAHE